MRKQLNNKKLVVYITFALALVGAVVLLLVRSKSFAGTIENVFAEENYTIISQVPCDLTLSIPRNSIPEEAFTEEGYTFSENEIIAYQTETTSIYLEHVQLSNESDDDLYFSFNCYYKLPESGSFISSYYKTQEGWYRSDVSLKSKNLRDDVTAYEDTLAVRGHGPGQRFAFYVSADACKGAVGTIYIDVNSCYEITYHKNE